MSRDPIGYGAGDNLYEYVRSSPITFVDSLGLSAEDVRRLQDWINQWIRFETANGNRIDDGWRNDSYFWKYLLGIEDHYYWGCHEQRKYLHQDLTEILSTNLLRLDATWTVSTVNWGVHSWLDMRSSDPADPHIFVDPWRPSVYPYR
jgi:hypothetical protein